MDLFENLGKALRWLRDCQGKKQYEVAESAGITKGMLCAYETGKQRPSLETLDKILRALGSDLLALHEALALVKGRYSVRLRGGACRRRGAARRHDVERRLPAPAGRRQRGLGPAARHGGRGAARLPQAGAPAPGGPAATPRSGRQRAARVLLPPPLAPAAGAPTP